MLCATDWRKSIQMRQYRIEITKIAEEDLENVGDYIAYKLKNRSAAKNTVSGIRKRTLLYRTFGL